MNLTEIQKMRKDEIKSHFENVLKKAKTFEQINSFYYRVGNMILGMLKYKEVLYEYYDYEGLKLYKDDIPLLELIFEEHNKKRKILEALE